jgi:hypothetical protein
MVGILDVSYQRTGSGFTEDWFSVMAYGMMHGSGISSDRWLNDKAKNNVVPIVYRCVYFETIVTWVLGQEIMGWKLI